jgi:hypothetical protein
MIEVANDAEYEVEELKRCKCGGKAELKERSGRTFPYWVQCKHGGCGALTTFTRSAGAAKALWNTGRIQPGMTDG